MEHLSKQMFERIYKQGLIDWLRQLDRLSPMLAERVRRGQMPMGHALHLLGIETGAFQCDRPTLTDGKQGRLFK